MDNRVTLPGYKYYLDPLSGERPAVHVAYLDIVEDPGGVADGIVFEVDEAGLAALDDRERNYARVAVEIEGEPVWIYAGSAAGRERFAAGLAAGDLVVDAAYLALVPDVASVPPPCPVVPLQRVDLPRR